MFINYLAFILWLLIPFNPPQLIINPSRITIKALSSFKLVTYFGCIWTNNVLRGSIIKKLKPIFYCPYIVLQYINDNGCHQYFPSFLDIHNIIYVNHLKLYEPSILEEEVQVCHLADNIHTLVDLHTCYTCHQ